MTSRRGPRRAAQLDDRHEMRRIDRMRDEAAGAAGEGFGETATPGSPTSSSRGRPTAPPGRSSSAKTCRLTLERFGQVLLHPVRARPARLRARRRTRSREPRPGDIGDEPMARLLARLAAMNVRAASSCAANGDRERRTRQPARANTIAHARPMSPAPMIAAVLSIASHFQGCRYRAGKSHAGRDAQERSREGSMATPL